MKSLFARASLGLALFALPLWAHAAPPPCPVSKIDDLAPSAVVATVSGSTITAAQLDEAAGQSLCRARLEARQKLDELRGQTLERLIDERLLEAEAKKQKLAGVEALLEKEMAGVGEPTPAEVEAFYAQFKDRMQGATLEQMAPEIRQFLQSQGRQKVYQDLVGRLRLIAKVTESLPVLRMPVEAIGPSRGAQTAPITIVMFSDYECPYCARGAESLEAVRAQYGDKVRVVYRDFPLEFHHNALPAAVAARCAGAQGKYWEMHDLLYANQRALDAAALKSHAAALKLDTAAFETCQADPKHAAAVKADMAAGAALGVQGTPAFFINGIQLSGALPPEAFAKIIDRELARAPQK